MSACVRKSFLPSLALKFEEEVSPKVIEKQGIVSILGSDSERTKAASLRRTFSADMSSKKWLAQNGFHLMKKVASSEELLAISTANHSFSSPSEDEYEGKEDLERPRKDDAWRLIQPQKEKKEVEKPHGWTWGSILTHKNTESNELPAPYIHPLVKRSTSSLSEKSLEICTESLGSETGSDRFSYPPSEAGDVHEEKDDEQQPQWQSFEDLQFVKYNYSPNRKMPARSFPPPLTSRACEDGVSLRMHCHRQNGRLVLEAVSVSSHSFFRAERQDGRLLLTLVHSPSSQEARNEDMEHEDEECAQVFDNIEEIGGNKAELEDDGYEIEEEEDAEVEEEEELEMEPKFEKENGKREMEFVLEHNSKMPGDVIKVHNSTLLMKKPMAQDNKNLTWSPKFNKTVNLIDIEEVVSDDELTQLPQSLPPPPRVARMISTAPPATAASFNAYEYFWGEKPSVASIIKPIPEERTPLKNNQNKVTLASNLKGYEQQNLVVVRGNRAEYLVPLLRRCNEPRRSLLLWEPYCIATS